MYDTAISSAGLVANISWYQNGVWVGTVPIDLEYATRVVRALVKAQFGMAD